MGRRITLSIDDGEFVDVVPGARSTETIDTADERLLIDFFDSGKNGARFDFEKRATACCLCNRWQKMAKRLCLPVRAVTRGKSTYLERTSDDGTTD